MSNTSEFVRCIGFDSANNEWRNDCEDFLTGASGIAAPAVLFILLLVLTAMCYALAQCFGVLFCICRGCRLSKEGAPVHTVRLHRVLLWMAAVALAATAAVCSTSNESLRSSMSDLQQQIVNVEVATQSLADRLDSAVQDFVSSSDATERWGYSVAYTTTDACGDVRHWAHVMRDVEKNLTRYLWAIDAVIWLVVVVLLGFAATTLLNVHRIVPVVIFCVVFVVGVCVMGLQGAAGLAYEFTHTACSEQGDVVSSVNSFFGADRYTHSSSVAALGALPLGIDQVYASAMCVDDRSALRQLCVSAFDCPAECWSAQSVADFLSSTSLRAGSVDRGDCTGQCTVLECATKCRSGSTVQVLSQQVSEVVEKYGLASIASAAAKEKIVDAELFKAGVSSAVAVVCAGDMTDSLEKLSHVLTAASALVAVGAVLVCLTSYTYHGTKGNPERELIFVSSAPLYSGPAESSVQQPVVEPAHVGVVYGQVAAEEETDIEARTKDKEAAL